VSKMKAAHESMAKKAASTAARKSVSKKSIGSILVSCEGNDAA
jgi:hypothetical protein